jgi:hypothetical protein
VYLVMLIPLTFVRSATRWGVSMIPVISLSEKAIIALSNPHDIHQLLWPATIHGCGKGGMLFISREIARGSNYVFFIF